MKNLKLLNKIIFQFLILIIFLPVYAEETVDIWKSDNSLEKEIDILPTKEIEKMKILSLEI